MSAPSPALQAPPPSAGVRTWLLAARPKTLTAALAPVAVGTGLAFGAGGGRWLLALAALLGALLIQVGTNLTNDYYDFRRGADTEERLGPLRVTQAGLVAPRTVLSAAGVCFGAAAMVGLFLVAAGGWPVVAIRGRLTFRSPPRAPTAKSVCFFRVAYRRCSAGPRFYRPEGSMRISMPVSRTWTSDGA